MGDATFWSVIILGIGNVILSIISAAQAWHLKILTTRSAKGAAAQRRKMNRKVSKVQRTVNGNTQTLQEEVNLLRTENTALKASLLAAAKLAADAPEVVVARKSR